MYDILNKMKLLEGKGSKPDFLDLDKDGNKTEPMKKAAKKVSKSVEKEVKEAEIPKHLQGAKKSDIPAFKRKPLTLQDLEDEQDRVMSHPDTLKKINRGEPLAGKAVKEADMEEGNDFTGARQAAIKAGKPTFRVDGTTYRVTGDTSDEKSMEEALDMNLLKAAQKRAAEKPGPRDAESDRNIHKKYGHRSDRDDEGGADDDYDEWGNFKGKKKAAHVVPGEKRGRGRPKGTGKSIGAKGPSGKSKLLTRESDLEEDRDLEVDAGEFDREGDMAKEQLHTIEAAAKELHDLLSDDQNLPEWVQSKITKAMDYIDTARDYMLSHEAESDEELVPERKLSSSEKEEREDIVKGMKKNKGDFKKRYGKRGEEVMYATATKMAKERGPGNPDRKKKKEEVEETTVAGSVATAPTSGKAKGIFGKGVYEGQVHESYNKKLQSLLTESVNVSANMGVDDQGQPHKTITVTANDEAAEALAQLLGLAGMQKSYQSVCPACGQEPCGCEHDEIDEELANSAHNTDYSDTDTMVNTLSGGLNGRKSTGQTTLPVINRDPRRQGVEGAAEEIREQQESRLWEIYTRYSK